MKVDSLWLTNDRRPRPINLRQFHDYEYFKELLDQYVDLKIPDVVTVSWQPLRPLLRSLEGDEDREQEFVDHVAGLITAGVDVPPLLLEDGPQIYDGNHRAWAAWQAGVRLAPTVDIGQYWAKTNPGETGQPQVLYHGTKEPFTSFDKAKTADGAFHFGTREQAAMRAGPRGVLIPVTLQIQRLRRSRDVGGRWKTKIAAAKSAGFDGIVYLNRYEGILPSTSLRAIEQGVTLDRLSDADFRRFAPEANDSYIAFYADQVRVLRHDLLHGR